MELIKPIAIWFISPLNVIVTLLALSLIFKLTNRSSKAKKVLLCAVSLVLISSQSYVSDLLLYPLEHKYSPSASATFDNPDFIAVLACYYNTESDNIPEVSKFHSCSLERLVQAAALQLQYNVPIIVTGGHFLADKDISYAKKASYFLGSLGINQADIITIDEGYDTFSELVAISTVVQQKSLITVSSASHGYRVGSMAKELDLDLSFYPVDYLSNGELLPYLSLPNTSAINAIHRALYEYLAIAKYSLIKTHIV